MAWNVCVWLRNSSKFMYNNTHILCACVFMWSLCMRHASFKWNDSMGGLVTMFILSNKIEFIANHLFVFVIFMAAFANWEHFNKNFPSNKEKNRENTYLCDFVCLSISFYFSHLLLNPFHQNIGRLGLSVSAGRLCNASPKILRQFVLVNANINYNRWFTNTRNECWVSFFHLFCFVFSLSLLLCCFYINFTDIDRLRPKL